MRYEAYVQKGKAFPHEIGVLLGYPAEDVKGFVVNEGKIISILVTGRFMETCQKQSNCFTNLTGRRKR